MVWPTTSCAPVLAPAPAQALPFAGHGATVLNLMAVLGGCEVPTCHEKRKQLFADLCAKFSAENDARAFRGVLLDTVNAAHHAHTSLLRYGIHKQTKNVRWRINRVKTAMEVASLLFNEASLFFED